MNSTPATETQTLTTSDLFTATHRALCAKAWGDARLLLEALAMCPDNHDKFCDAVAYGAPQFIADRIELVNSLA